jgi:hypothetical protein
MGIQIFIIIFALTLRNLMKPFLITPSFFLLLVTGFSCGLKKNVLSKESIDTYYKYAVIINFKNPTGRKTTFASKISADTTFLFEKEDSTACLKAKIQFRQYVANWNIEKKPGAKEPVSFKLLNEKAEDIAGNLSAAQSKKADSSVKTYIEQKINTRYSISDNVQSLDNITQEKNVTDTSDIKKADKARQHQLYTRGGKYTYSPI